METVTELETVTARTGFFLLVKVFGRAVTELELGGKIMMQEWFPKAKLGIFIHYGIYAVGDVSESWSFHNGNISYEDYMKQCDGFTASKFDAAAWADLFKRAGARYVVMTTKHHDGVALFDTQYSDLSVVKKTPAARDLVKE